ncbi:MAG: hypothetical protein ACI3ZG_02120 [Candidatus Coprenecus sp.]
MAGSVSPLPWAGNKGCIYICLPTVPMWKPVWAAQRCSYGKSLLRKKGSIINVGVRR